MTRSLVLPIAALTCLLMPALAQAQGRTDQNFHPPAQSSGALDAQTGHEPLSNRASNIDSADTKSKIAPALPQPPLGENATAADYLRVAEQALATGKTGLAQSSLEDAETQLLSRSVPLFQTDKPDTSPAIGNINQALRALAAHDLPTALALVQKTIPMTEAMKTK